MYRILLVLVAWACVIFYAWSVRAHDNLKMTEYTGPYVGEVIRVIDGDTLKASVAVWPGMYITTNVRIDGIDTPELRGKCAVEKVLAQHAKESVEKAVKQYGGVIILHNVRLGKYSGRVVANVTAGVRSIRETLLETTRQMNGKVYPLARRYDGGKRKGWC